LGEGGLPPPKFPGQGAGAEEEFACLIVGEHDEDVTAVLIHPLPPLPHRLPMTIEANPPHLYAAVWLEETFYAD
jgi:hypothetical protein